MKIVILTRPQCSSPRILAESLHMQIRESDHDTEILFDVDTLSRLVGFMESKLSFHFWLKKKIFYWYKDNRVMRTLKEADAVVISECIPNAYIEKLYNVTKLKTIIKKPVLIYEVYWLGNAPTQIASLQQRENKVCERYDGNLFVSPITEIRVNPLSNSFCLGLLAKNWHLQPLPKKELVVLVDFVQPEFKSYRDIQICQLEKAGIPYVSLERFYTIDEIRKIYQDVSIYFMQSYEAFGLPILECLCAGAQVFTPDSGWPMSWRLDENPEVHGPGTLPNCFTVYNGEDDLLMKLLEFKDKFNPVETPLQVFNEFLKTYPTFYEGNRAELNRCLDYIKSFIN